MKYRLPVCLSVFAAVFLIGISAVWWRQRENRTGKPPGTGKPAADSLPQKPAAVPPPLTFPGDAAVAAGTEGSWEYIGTIPRNYVSAGIGIGACFRQQKWTEKERIKLDESLHPLELRTFHRDGYELLLQIWRINTGTTGFACRRYPAEKKEKNL